MKKRCMILIAGLTALCMGCSGEADILSENEILEEQPRIDNAENKAETEITPVQQEEQEHAVEEDNQLQITSVPEEKTKMEHKTEDEEILTVNGYVIKIDMDTDGTVTDMYLDTENPGGRVFPDEGKDRMVAFDITESELEILKPSNMSEEDALSMQGDTIKAGLSVYVEYFEEDGRNIATYIETTGIEEELRAVEVIADGKVLAIDENNLYMDTVQAITWGNLDETRLGETLLDITYIKKMPEKLEPGMEITVVYYFDAYGESESNFATEIYIKE